MWGVGRVGRSFLKLLSSHPPLLELGKDLQINVVGLADSRTAILLENREALDQIIAHKVSTGCLPAYPGVEFSVTGFQQWLEQARLDVLIDSSWSDFESAQPALDLYRSALGSGVAVISANKPPLVQSLRDLSVLAASRGTWLRYGATIGASLPVWDLLAVLSRQESFSKLEMVLNGTTNWIITEMEKRGIDYQEALVEAQRLGFAEPDPTRDIMGLDTAAKLLILANSFWKESFAFDDIEIQGITRLTPELLKDSRAGGRAAKLVGRLVGGPSAWRLTVGPLFLEREHPLAGLTGTQKGVYLETISGGHYALTGGASGPGPTAASMLRELMEILNLPPLRQRESQSL